jgi:type VI protein secretion system component Hcp
MKTLIFLLLLTPFISLSQKTDVYVKLTDAKGQQIKGDAVVKGFERWIGATTISSGGKNNTVLSFTMPVSGASADLKRALATEELLLTGQATVLSPNQTGGGPIISYTIKMENIIVSSCRCDGLRQCNEHHSNPSSNSYRLDLLSKRSIRGTSNFQKVRLGCRN